MPLSEQQQKAMDYYTERYDPIFASRLVLERPVYLPKQTPATERTCRFCGRSAPEVDFKQKAHAIPDSLGNQSLFSTEECDECNAFFGREYEDDLAKWFGPMRTFTQMRGKKGVPTYVDKPKEHGGKIRAEVDEAGVKYEVVSKETLDQLLENGGEGPFSFTFPVATPTQPYSPLRAAKALVKIGCSLVPPEELEQCALAIDWLTGRKGLGVTVFPVMYAFTPGPDPHQGGYVLILRRKNDEHIPYLWCIFATTNFQFQYFIPFCPKDEWLTPGQQTEIKTVRYPVPLGPEYEAKYGKSDFHIENWSNPEKIVREPIATFNVDRAERVERKGDDEEAAAEGGSP